MKVIKLTTTTQASEVKKQSGIFQGIANSLDFTRSGIRVSESAGESVIGQKVPLLLSHNWEKPSIGSVTMTAVDKDGLHYEAKIYESAPDRDLLLEGIENGTNFVSIGFGADGIDAEGNIDSIDLIELSLTSTPADPKATAQLVKQAIEDNKGDDMEDDKKGKMKGKMADQEPTDDNLLPALNPLYPKGTKITVLADHMDGMKGATGVVTNVYLANTYAIDYQPTDGSSEVKGHRWVTEDEIANQNSSNNTNDNTDKPNDEPKPADDKDAELQSLREVNAQLLSIAKKARSRDLTVRESSYLRKQSLAK